MSPAVIAPELTPSSYSYYGTSAEALQVQKYDPCLERLTTDSVTIYDEPYRRAERELAALSVDCAVDDWDGDGARAVMPLSLWHAHRFIRALPIQWLDLEISVDPDGEVSLDWFREEDRSLSISVGIHGELTYAGMYGNSRAYGVEYFSEAIPRVILLNLKRLT